MWIPHVSATILIAGDFCFGDLMVICVVSRNWWSLKGRNVLDAISLGFQPQYEAFMGFNYHISWNLTNDGWLVLWKKHENLRRSPSLCSCSAQDVASWIHMGPEMAILILSVTSLFGCQQAIKTKWTKSHYQIGMFRYM